MATAPKFVLPIAIFLAYLIPLDVDVTGNITAKLCEVGSEFNIFCTLVTMAMVTIFSTICISVSIGIDQLSVTFQCCIKG